MKLDLASSRPFNGGAKGNYRILIKGEGVVEGLVKLYPSRDGCKKALKFEFKVLEELEHKNILTLKKNYKFIEEITFEQVKLTCFVLSAAKFSVADWIPDRSKIRKVNVLALKKKNVKETLQADVNAKISVVLHDIFMALKYVHGKNMAHLDVQLSNLFVCTDEGQLNVKLSGFDSVTRQPNVDICCEGRVLYAEKEALEKKFVWTKKECTSFVEKGVEDQNRHYHCNAAIDFFQLAKSLLSQVAGEIKLVDSIEKIAENPGQAAELLKNIKATADVHRKMLYDAVTKKR